MIFVTVGTGMPFPRMVHAVDELARKHVFGSERVFIQSGEYADFQSDVCTVKPFLGREEFDALMNDASLVISHGGTTVFTAMRLGKPVIAFPRLERYNEHINDHQLYFVRELAKRDWLIPAYEPADLQPAVLRATSGQWRPPKTNKAPIHSMVEAKLNAYLK